MGLVFRVKVSVTVKIYGFVIKVWVLYFGIRFFLLRVYSLRIRVRSKVIV